MLLWNWKQSHQSECLSRSPLTPSSCHWWTSCICNAYYHILSPQVWTWIVSLFDYSVDFDLPSVNMSMWNIDREGSLDAKLTFRVRESKNKFIQVMELGWKAKFMRYARQIFVIEFFLYISGREAFSVLFSLYMHAENFDVSFLSFFSCDPDR